MKQRTIHILGGGQWQLPSVMLAKSLGYRAFVTDMYEERPAYAYADTHEVIDITDMDATLAAAKRQCVDGIICDTTDVGVPTMAYVAEALGLPGIGYTTALNFTDKFRMRTLTAAAGVPNPPFRLVANFEEFCEFVADTGLPAVVKPIDNQSSRGVHIVRRREGMEEAFEDARRWSRGGKVIAEGFLDGLEVTAEGYCVEGEVFTVGVSDKDHFGHRPEVANRLTYPPDLPVDTIRRIEATNEQVVRALGLCTGVTHAEYMLVGSEVFLVEIAARGGGSRIYSHIVPHLAGVPVPRMYLEFLMGNHEMKPPDDVKRAANLAFFSFPPGRVKRILGVDEAAKLPGVVEILLEFTAGDTLCPPQDDRSRPGHVVTLGKTRREVLDTTRAVFDLVRVETA